MDKLLICIGLKSPISLSSFLGSEPVLVWAQGYHETLFEDLKNFSDIPTNSPCFYYISTGANKYTIV